MVAVQARPVLLVCLELMRSSEEPPNPKKQLGVGAIWYSTTRTTLRVLLKVNLRKYRQTKKPLYLRKEDS